ncbi:MAG: sulfotransferase [Nitrosopumilus sp.]|nr:sulfotransferase [Nitrosopumilus sp.]
MNSIAIQLSNVFKKFDLGKNKSFPKGSHLTKNILNQIQALDNISLTIKKGETIGIIGLNGSGKTTLLRIISGVYAPDSGSVEINGYLAPLLQIGTGFKKELDAEENIVMYGLLLGFTKNEIKRKVDDIIKFAELEKFRKLKLENYSAGMRTRLAFSTAIQINPDILLVDEILAVGDAVFKEKSFKAFLEFKKQNKTIVYTTHNFNMILDLSDRVILMDQGRILKIGKPSDVISYYKEIIKTHKPKSFKHNNVRLITKAETISSDKSIIKPIFIIGVPRSGTTMLNIIMCMHPDLAWFSHEDLKFLIPLDEQKKFREKFLRMKENNEKIPRTEGSLFVFGLDQARPLEGTSKVPIEAESFWRRYIDFYESEISSNKKRDLKKILDKILTTQDKLRFLNKAPQNTVRIFAIKQVFPDAKFINIARDPRSVISSMLTRTKNEGQFNIDWAIKEKKLNFQNSKKNNELIKYYAEGYKDITDYTLEFSKQQNSENFMTIIYEDFISNPEENLKKLLDFCELKVLEPLSQMIPRKIRDTTEKWKTELTEDDQQKIFDIVQDSIDKMKYPFKL